MNSHEKDHGCHERKIRQLKAYENSWSQEFSHEMSSKSHQLRVISIPLPQGEKSTGPNLTLSLLMKVIAPSRITKVTQLLDRKRSIGYTLQLHYNYMILQQIKTCTCIHVCIYIYMYIKTSCACACVCVCVCSLSTYFYVYLYECVYMRVS